MMHQGKIYAMKGQMDETARARFNEIKKAYKVLSNPYRRATYDATLEKQPEVGHLQQRLKNWLLRQWIAITGWKINTQQIINRWQEGKQQVLEGWQLGEQNIAKGWQFGEKPVVKGWQFVKQQVTTKYIYSALVPGEKVLYQATIHWLFYLDLGALFLIILSSYLLINHPSFLNAEDSPFISVWVPPLFSKELVDISVWEIGLTSLFCIGLLILAEVFIAKQTTELVVTSKRVVAKFGFLTRTIIELKLRRFESITVEQSILGRIFNYGTLTITGMGGVKTTVPSIMAPLRFKRVLWQVLDYVFQEGYE